MDERDHRHLGVKHKLWHLQDDAPGMVFWHPRGTAIYRVLEDYVDVSLAEAVSLLQARARPGASPDLRPERKVIKPVAAAS